jgi:hypothetical protein
MRTCMHDLQHHRFALMCIAQHAGSRNTFQKFVQVCYLKTRLSMSRAAAGHLLAVDNNGVQAYATSNSDESEGVEEVHGHCMYIYVYARAMLMFLYARAMLMFLYARAMLMFLYARAMLMFLYARAMLAVSIICMIDKPPTPA